MCLVLKLIDTSFHIHNFFTKIQPIIHDGETTLGDFSLLFERDSGGQHSSSNTSDYSGLFKIDWGRKKRHAIARDLLNNSFVVCIISGCTVWAHSSTLVPGSVSSRYISFLMAFPHPAFQNFHRWQCPGPASSLHIVPFSSLLSPEGFPQTSLHSVLLLRLFQSTGC